MNCDRSTCLDCPAKVICRCLQVTEATLVDAINSLDLQTLKDVRRHTGAGDGCTCCHGEIRQYLEQVRSAAVA
jgi:NAD(P)H-nitrite reductase large subunit